MTPSGIETATFWLIAQCLNQLRYSVPYYCDHCYRGIPSEFHLLPDQNAFCKQYVWDTAPLFLEVKKNGAAALLDPLDKTNLHGQKAECIQIRYKMRSN